MNYDGSNSGYAPESSSDSESDYHHVRRGPLRSGHRDYRLASLASGPISDRMTAAPSSHARSQHDSYRHPSELDSDLTNVLERSHRRPNTTEFPEHPYLRGWPVLRDTLARECQHRGLSQPQTIEFLRFLWGIARENELRQIERDFEMERHYEAMVRVEDAILRACPSLGGSRNRIWSSTGDWVRSRAPEPDDSISQQGRQGSNIDSEGSDDSSSLRDSRVSGSRSSRSFVDSESRGFRNHQQRRPTAFSSSATSSNQPSSSTSHGHRSYDSLDDSSPPWNRRYSSSSEGSNGLGRTLYSRR